MTVAVLDTNTIVSGTLESRGIPHRLIEAARAEHFTLITSDVIIGEVFTTLNRDRTRRKYQINAADLERLRELLERETISVALTTEVLGVATHPEDDLILATAVSAHADYLATGDAQLRKLGRYEGVAIVSPREFLGILSEDITR